MKKQEQSEKPFLRSRLLWLSVAGSFLLLITNSAVWLNRYLFNEQAFATTVTTSLTSESSRHAIAERITDAALEDRPVAQQVAGNVATNAISGLLNTSLANKAIYTAAERLNVAATSSDQEDIVINLGGIKDISARLVNAAAALGRDTQVDPDRIPDSITIIEEEQIPDFYRLGVVFLWIAPVALLVAIAAFAYPYFSKPRDIKKILAVQGACLTLIGLLGLLIGPLFRPPVLSAAKTSSGRTVIGNLYDAFISTFNAQTSVVILFGVLVLLVGVGAYMYPAVRATFKNK